MHPYLAASKNAFLIYWLHVLDNSTILHFQERDSIAVSLSCHSTKSTGKCERYGRSCVRSDDPRGLGAENRMLVDGLRRHFQRFKCYIRHNVLFIVIHLVLLR